MWDFQYLLPGPRDTLNFFYEINGMGKGIDQRKMSGNYNVASSQAISGAKDNYLWGPSLRVIQVIEPVPNGERRQFEGSGSVLVQMPLASVTEHLSYQFKQ